MGLGDASGESCNVNRAVAYPVQVLERALELDDGTHNKADIINVIIMNLFSIVVFNE